MRYYANPSTLAVRDAMRAGWLGAIVTPGQGGSGEELPVWCADNGCGPGAGGVAGRGYVGDARFLAWLESLLPHAGRCSFAVAPDVVGNAAATLERADRWLPVIAGLGYVPAFVAQNGQDQLPVPWDEFGTLFIGGDDVWKLGPQVRELVAEARARGKQVHMGRVNSLKRMRYARGIGCDSADGTFIRWGPDRNLPEALGWVRDARDQEILWVGG